MDTATHTDSVELDYKVRFALEPHNTTLIHQWLAAVQTNAEDWRGQLHPYRVLLAALMDTTLPLDWRYACLEAIQTLLHRLTRSAPKREVQRLHFEVTMCCRCCLPGSVCH